MAGFKLLIDTNVVIGLEDARPVSESFAEIVRLSNEHKVDLFVDSANYDDVSRDRDPARRAITLSKLAKFQRLRVIPATSEATLVAKFGPLNSENDRSDVRLLAAIEASAADFLVTQDNDLRRRAGRSGLDAKVLTVEEALEWLRQTFQEISVELPYVSEEKAYQIDRTNPIFHSLRPRPRKHGLELSRDGSPCESRGVAPEGGRAPIWRAAAKQISGADCVHLSAVYQQAATFVDVVRQWLACAFRRFASLFLPGANLFFVRGRRQNSGA
jgi:predicted nucleic acid-binding protein